MRDLKRSSRLYWLWAAIAFSAVVCTIFAATLFSRDSLFAGDAPGLCRKTFVLGDALSHYMGNWGWGNSSLGDGYGATALNPLRLLRDLLTVFGKHMALTYISCCLLLFLGTVYYLRGLGIALQRTFAPAIGLAYAGYSFTLIKAGHVGFFQMMVYAVFAFGLLHRAILQHSLLHYALAGTCVIWGISVQPDMMMPITMLLAAYGLFLCCLAMWRTSWAARRKFALQTLCGLGVASVCFGVFGIGAFGFIFETIVPQRSEEVGKSPEEKWIFATNWSLPVDEAAELISPNIFGIDSESAEVPYWGALGRPHDWEANVSALAAHFQRASTDEQRQAVRKQYVQYLGARNFRQHTVYLGVFQLVLACLGIALAVGCLPVRKRAGELSEPDDGVVSITPYIFFWAVVLLVSILLAFGRYAPFYRVAYAFPWLRRMRAPVKYLRLADLSLAFLFGLGLEMVARCGLCGSGGSVAARSGKRVQGTRWPYFVLIGICSVACLAFALALVGTAGMPTALVAKWRSMGLFDRSTALHRQMVVSMVHSCVLFGLSAAVLLLLLRKRSSSAMQRWLPWVALLVVSADVAAVGRKFIYVRDKTSFYAPNPVADIINADVSRPRTDNLFIPYNKLNPVSHNWAHHGIYSLRPSTTRLLKSDMAEFFDALRGHEQRLWELTSTGYVLLPRTQLARFAQAGLKEVTDFTIENERYVLTERGRGPLVLCSVADVLPYVSVYHAWRFDRRDAVLRALSSDAWDPRSTVLCEREEGVSSEEGTEGVSAAVIIQQSRTRLEVSVDIGRKGILLVNEAYHPDVVVRVDGKVRPLIRCNGVMRGVALEPGGHRVVFTYHPYLVPLILNIVVTAALFGWCIVFAYRRHTRKSSL